MTDILDQGLFQGRAVALWSVGACIDIGYSVRTRLVDPSLDALFHNAASCINSLVAFDEDAALSGRCGNQVPDRDRSIKRNAAAKARVING